MPAETATDRRYRRVRWRRRQRRRGVGSTDVGFATDGDDAGAKTLMTQLKLLYGRHEAFRIFSAKEKEFESR